MSSNAHFTSLKSIRRLQCHIQAREWMIDAMLSYCRHARQPRMNRSLSAPSSNPANAQSHAALSLASGLQGLDALEHNPLDLDDRGLVSSNIVGIGRASTSSISAPAAPDRDVLDARNDRYTVEAELRRYEDEGTRKFQEGETLLSTWESNRGVYPHMFRVAMDILPVQALAVSCERVFSSSKETITPRRSCLSGATVEMLQFLKYRFLRERLESGVLADKEDYSLDSPLSSDAIDELVQLGHFDVIKEIYYSQQEVTAQQGTGIGP